MREPFGEAQFGAIKGRRREEAVVVQLQNQFLCKRAGISCMSKFFDVRNAFYCVVFGGLQKFYGQCKNDFARSFYEQILENCITRLECCDGNIS